VSRLNYRDDQGLTVSEELIPIDIRREAVVLEKLVENYIYDELGKSDCFRFDITKDEIYLVFIPDYRGIFKMRGLKFNLIKKLILNCINKRERVEEAKQNETCSICDESVKCINACFEVVFERGILDRNTFLRGNELSECFFCSVCKNSCCIKCELKIVNRAGNMVCPYCRDKTPTRFKF